MVVKNVILISETRNKGGKIKRNNLKEFKENT